jgi:hypothetical protein
MRIDKDSPHVHEFTLLKDGVPQSHIVWIDTDVNEFCRIDPRTRKQSVEKLTSAYSIRFSYDSITKK